MRKWIEINLEKGYIIFADEPRKKYPIEDGSVKLDMSKKKLKIQYRLK